MAELKLHAKVEKMWKAMPTSNGEIVNSECWDHILADYELAALLGNGSISEGLGVLRAMKDAKMLDASGNGQIEYNEFLLLFDPVVMAAAVLRAKIEKMWKLMPRNAEYQVERLYCWDIILADAELPRLIGDSDPEKGLSMLRAMKDAKALDISGDGMIEYSEFMRLCNPDVIADAKKASPLHTAEKIEAALHSKVEAAWKQMQLDDSGEVGVSECFDTLLTDYEFANLIGKGRISEGRLILNAIKEAKLGDHDPDKRINYNEYLGLFDKDTHDAAVLRVKVEKMWKDMPRNDMYQVDRLICWDIVLADFELAELIGKSDAEKGLAMLRSMKSPNALSTEDGVLVRRPSIIDVSGDGMIEYSEFLRFCDPDVLAEAEKAAPFFTPDQLEVALREKVEKMWSTVVKNDKGEVEFFACWDLILVDEELASLVGMSNVEEGRAILSAMKDAKAIDVNGDGVIDYGEFLLLFDERIRSAALLRAKVEKVWKRMPLNEDGEVEDTTCWGVVLADYELALLVGNSSISEGRLVLTAMKDAKALDVSGNGLVDRSEFFRIFDLEVMAAAVLRAKIEKMWKDMPRDAKYEVEKALCWDLVLRNAEFYKLVGRSDPKKGVAMLLAMKDGLNTLDANGDGMVDYSEFMKLGDANNLAAAEAAAPGFFEAAEEWLAAEAAAPAAALTKEEKAAAVKAKKAALKAQREEEMAEKRRLRDEMKQQHAEAAAEAKHRKEEINSRKKARKAAEVAQRRAAKKNNSKPDQRFGKADAAITEIDIVKLRVKVEKMWKEMPTSETGDIELSTCWGLIMADYELAGLIGNASISEGLNILRAMKEAKMLDLSGDGQINYSEFLRLFDPTVMAAAVLRAYVEKMWKEMPRNAEYQIERLACWDIIMEDEELAALIGKSDAVKGAAMLRSMKEVKALDISGDGMIEYSEFMRLCNADVLAQAEESFPSFTPEKLESALHSKVESLWMQLPVGETGEIEAAACWDLILADYDLAALMGKGSISEGRLILSSMREAKMLDVSGEGQIDRTEFQRLFDSSVISAAVLRVKVEKMWKEMPRDAEYQVERLVCWDIILGDYELAELIGNSDAEKGLAMLRAMKSARALDISGDGMINYSEFLRLCNPDVLAAAEKAAPSQSPEKIEASFHSKVQKMWKDMPKNAKGEVEFFACWDVILADVELASLIGLSNLEEGRAILNAMKDAKAIDVNGDGMIDYSEFLLLFDERIKAAAVLRAKVEKVWKRMPLTEDGDIDSRACWDIILSDYELAGLLGNSSISQGRTVLTAMKDSKALDLSGDGRIDRTEFMRLFDPSVISSAVLRAKIERLWKDMPRNAQYQVVRLTCWDILLADWELAALLGKSDAVKGMAMLRSMKDDAQDFPEAERRASTLDASGDGMIDYGEILRLCDPELLSAAERAVADADAALAASIERAAEAKRAAAAAAAEEKRAKQEEARARKAEAAALKAEQAAKPPAVRKAEAVAKKQEKRDARKAGSSLDRPPNTTPSVRQQQAEARAKREAKNAERKSKMQAKPHKPKPKQGGCSLM